MVYADTNVFTNYLLPLPFHQMASEMMQLGILQGAVLPVPDLLRMEVTNALERLVFETRQGRQNLRVTPELAMMAEALFADELAKTDLWKPVTLDTTRLHDEFTRLVHRYTAKEGFRTYDVVHVASALTLECDAFWSFDAKVQKLAKLAGLRVNREP